MAGAYTRNSTLKNKTSKTSKDHVTFLAVRECYLPGELVALSFQLSKRYRVSSEDVVMLQRYPSYEGHNPYRWKACGCVENDGVHTLTIRLPVAEGKINLFDYQFVYLSSGFEAIGKSLLFKLIDSREPEEYASVKGLSLADEVDSSQMDYSDKFIKRYLIKDPKTMLAKIWNDSLHDNTGRIPGESLEATRENAVTPYTAYQPRMPQKFSKQAYAGVAQLIKLFETVNNMPVNIPKQVTSEGATPKAKSLLEPQYAKFLDSLNFDSTFTQSAAEDRVTYYEELVNPSQTLFKELQKMSCPRALFKEDDDPSSSVEGCLNSSRILDIENTQSTCDRLTKMMQDIDALDAEVDMIKKEMKKYKRELKTKNAYLNRLNDLLDGRKRVYDNFQGLAETLECQACERSEIIQELTNHIEALDQDIEVNEISHKNSLMLMNNHSGKKKTRRTKASTNTDPVNTREQSSSTNDTIGNVVKSLVQRANSYANPRDIVESTPASSNKKPATSLSQHDLCSGTTEEQKASWIKLLSKLIIPKPPSMPSSWLLSTEKTTPFGKQSSDESLAEAMRRLFDENSNLSLSNDQSHHSRLPSLESLREALHSLFGSEMSIIHKTGENNFSYPATPCNSAQTMRSPKGKPVELISSKSQSSSSESLRLALRRLFAVSDEALQEVLPGASKGSISSLDEAMRKLFSTISDADNTGKASALSTSSESLSDAMRWLFHHNSKENLASSNSSDSMLLWGLFDNIPDEFRELDVRMINKEKQIKSKSVNPQELTTPKEYDCWLLKPGIERKRNPEINSVIRSSSPDRDANISYPKSDRASSATQHLITSLTRSPEGIGSEIPRAPQNDRIKTGTLKPGKFAYKLTRVPKRHPPRCPYCRKYPHVRCHVKNNKRHKKEQSTTTSSEAAAA